MVGPDHQASITPLELKKMVTAMRNIEKALGKYEKKVTRSEKKNINIARKSIVAIKSIKKGELFSPQNIGVKRPGTEFLNKVFKYIGKKLEKIISTIN